MGRPRKLRTESTCPTCEQQFPPQRSAQECCSRRCAATLQHKRSGPTNWKGGRVVSTRGYVKVMSKGHPFSDRDGYVLEHRLVVEKQLGRYLMPPERVHHKNGVRGDNSDANLELWTMRHGGKKDPSGARVEDVLADLIHKHPELAAQILAARSND